LSEAAVRAPPSSSETAIMAWANQRQHYPPGPGQRRRNAWLLPMALVGAAAVAKPSSRGKLATGVHQFSIASVRSEMRPE